MLPQYIENCIVDRKMYQWEEIFQSSITSVIGEECESQLISLQMLDNAEWDN
jgi:hypothetical protein